MGRADLEWGGSRLALHPDWEGGHEKLCTCGSSLHCAPKKVDLTVRTFLKNMQWVDKEERHISYGWPDFQPLLWQYVAVSSADIARG